MKGYFFDENKHKEPIAIITFNTEGKTSEEINTNYYLGVSSNNAIVLGMYYRSSGGGGTQYQSSDPIWTISNGNTIRVNINESNGQEVTVILVRKE